MRPGRKEGVRKEDGLIGTGARFTISRLVLTQKLRFEELLSGCAQFCSAIQIFQEIFLNCPGWKLTCLKASMVQKSIPNLLSIINYNIGPGASWGCDKLSRVDMSKLQAASGKQQALQFLEVSVDRLKLQAASIKRQAASVKL